MISFRLIAITDSRLINYELLGIIELLCSIGIPAIQLREKHLNSSQQLFLAKKIKEISLNYHHTKLIINDRIDIAMLSGADGVHCPENGPNGNHLKQIAFPLIKGKSVHSLESALKAEKEGFDYVIAGPVFETPEKLKYGKPIGLKGLKEIASRVNIPVFAVGGVNSGNAAGCIDHGAFGIAGISEFMMANDIYRTFEYYKKLLDIKLYLYL